MIGSALIWCGLAGAAAAAPSLTSLNYDLADSAGGDSVTITGTNLTGATACTVGGVSAAITANTATSLTFTMPALTLASMPCFDGTNDYLENAGPITGFVSNAAGSIGVLFYVTAAAASAAADLKYNETLLFGDGNGNLTLTFSTAGVAFSSFNGVTWNSITLACTTAGWHYAQARWNSSTKELRLDGGAWSTLTHAVASLGAGAVRMGCRYDATTPFLSGYVGSVMTESARWSDTESNDLVRYINANFRQNFGGLGTSSPANPAARSLTCWLDAGDFAAGGTWTAKASAGTSSTRSFAQGTAGSRPSVATPTWASSHNVQVTTPGGSSNTLAIEAWNPSALSLTGFLKNNYAGAGAWSGNASGGPSGSNSFNAGSNYPAGASGDADFSGSNALTSGQIVNFFSANQGSFAILFKSDIAGPSDPAPSLRYTGRGLLTDSAGHGYFHLGYNAAGVYLSTYTSALYQSVLAACTATNWTLLQARMSGTSPNITIEVKANNGAWVTLGGQTNIGGMTGLATLGPGYGSSPLDGLMRYLLISSAALSDADFTRIRKFMNAKFGLSL